MTSSSSVSTYQKTLPLEKHYKGLVFSLKKTPSVDIQERAKPYRNFIRKLTSLPHDKLSIPLLEKVKKLSVLFFDNPLTQVKRVSTSSSSSSIPQKSPDIETKRREPSQKPSKKRRAQNMSSSQSRQESSLIKESTNKRMTQLIKELSEYSRRLDAFISPGNTSSSAPQEPSPILILNQWLSQATNPKGQQNRAALKARIIDFLLNPLVNRINFNDLDIDVLPNFRKGSYLDNKLQAAYLRRLSVATRIQLEKLTAPTRNIAMTYQELLKACISAKKELFKPRVLE